MEMRVLLGDGVRATGLSERLSAVVGSDRVSVNGDGREIGIRVERETDPSLLRVVDTVERWQHDEFGVGSVEMRFGERLLRLSPAVPVQAWQ